jgi:hypothetical protein
VTSRPETQRWDETVAHELVGGLLLIGVTVLDAAGGVTDKFQVYGRVSSADQTGGIDVKLRGNREGETYTLPPDTRAFRRAKPGNYTLKATGEVVVDPDFTTSWTFQQSAS